LAPFSNTSSRPEVYRNSFSLGHWKPRPRKKELTPREMEEQPELEEPNRRERRKEKKRTKRSSYPERKDDLLAPFSNTSSRPEVYRNTFSLGHWKPRLRAKELTPREMEEQPGLEEPNRRERRKEKKLTSMNGPPYRSLRNTNGNKRETTSARAPAFTTDRSQPQQGGRGDVTQVQIATVRPNYLELICDGGVSRGSRHRMNICPTTISNRRCETTPLDVTVTN
jgi:hypothetical protein